MIKVPITNVLQYNFENSVSLSNLISGGMWTSNIPESREENGVEVPIAMPYAVLSLEESSNEYTLGNSYIEHGKVSITIFDISADSVNNIIKELEVTWKHTTDLEIPEDTDTTFFHIFQLRKSLASEFTKDKDGNQIYSGLLLYEVSVFRK